MKKKKRYLALFLSLVMIFMLTVSSYADLASDSNATPYSESTISEGQSEQTPEEAIIDEVVSGDDLKTDIPDADTSELEDTSSGDESVNPDTSAVQTLTTKHTHHGSDGSGGSGGSSHGHSGSYGGGSVPVGSGSSGGHGVDPETDPATPGNAALASPSNWMIASYSNMIRTAQDEKLQAVLEKGTLVYKEPSLESGSFTLPLAVSVTIENHYYNDEETDEEWYEISYDNFLVNLISKIFDYRFVLADSIEVELEELEIPDCDCGYTGDGDLGDHADSCARKAHIRNIYIVNKTAEEIFEDWYELDADVQDAILEFLSWDDTEKLSELNALFEKEELASYMPTFYGSTESGVTVNIFAEDGAFSNGASMIVTDTDVDESAVEDLIKNHESFNDLEEFEIVKIKAVDIEFGEQPQFDVTLQMLVSADEIPESANQLYIVHFGESSAEIVSERALRTDITTHNIVVTVDSFSSYAAVFVNGKYSSKLMSEVLEDDGLYEIVSFPVNLFDYSPLAFNSALATRLNKTTDKTSGHFQFVGYDTNYGSNGGVNDSSSGYAKQGIVKDTLANGIPVFNYVYDGTENGKAFFDPNNSMSGKTVYKDVDFEFIYDTQTGYYEYKSSANHAQFNKKENVIKLYADTLSTENNSSQSGIGLQYGDGMNDVVTDSVDTSDGTWKATLKDDGKVRFDPYVSFVKDTGNEGLEINASEVNQIYIKAKIPAAVGSNQLQVFFQDRDHGYNEEMSFLVDYTANGDWIEFVIDTTEDKETKGDWKGTITGIRLDLFDGKKVKEGTQFDQTASYDVEISEIRFIKTNEKYQTWGGFYPFSDIADSYPGNSTEPFSLDTWMEELYDNEGATALATRSIGNPTSSKIDDQLAFGTVMEFDFYIPASKKTTSGEELTYYFNGDDDLWVFVDNKLVLDIGGGHGVISGTVNFTNGTSAVANAVAVTGFASNGGSAAEKTGTLDSGLTSPGKHTMKVFYLERCGSVSNCHMKFNLPQTPRGSVVVSKDVVLENYDSTNSAAEKVTNILNETEFTFTISAESSYSGGANGLPENYQVMDKDGNTTQKALGEGKTFTLKDGESAYFDIPELYNVTVSESECTIDGYVRTKTTVNGKEITGNQNTIQTSAGNKIEFNYVNTFTEKNVTYTYIPVNPSDCPDNVKGTVELTGSSSTATYAEAGVSETVGQRVDVPVGSTPRGSDAVRFVGWYEDGPCTRPITDPSTIAVLSGNSINPLPDENSGLYTGGIFYAKFEYVYGDLTIEKSGIEDVDHDEDGEKYSTIFKVTGTGNNGVSVDMTVTICGNNEVTVSHLPMGTYTVTELIDWSWRYEPVGEKERTVTLSQSTDGKITVTFKNKREENKWLDGNAWCRNIFNNNDIDVSEGSNWGEWSSGSND